jgi:peptide/nickel transport system substrate-binding protein
MRLRNSIRRLALAALLACGCAAAQQWGGELRLCLHSEPRTFDPALVDDATSETIRYLTGGVLVRVNRATQKLEPELAASWRVENGGKTVRFRLREGLLFSDGTPFTAGDVAYTVDRLMDPKLHSPTGDSFRSGSGAVTVEPRGRYEVAVSFPEPVAGVARLFDQVAVVSRQSPFRERAVLGPFRIAEHKPGSYLLLARNPNYWKTVGERRLPYLDALRLDILQNREMEALRFRQGQVHAISGVDPELFEQLAGARDVGPSLEGEQMWFNMAPAAPIPEFRRAWFASRKFRNAVSLAIRREDLCRVVYHGHASPGAGPFSPANLFWFRHGLAPHPFDAAAARRLLEEEGFHSGARGLEDRRGNLVEFSLVTNSGNRARERIAAMIQQDLAALGMRVNVVPLDFPSLLERITKSFRYEACLLGLTNVDLDPNAQMNVWLSSAANHQWNPGQASPATPWEAEIDLLMRRQAATVNDARRKPLFDRVQQIVWEQEPFLYLLNKNALVAVSPRLRNVEPTVLRPQVVWNVERLWLASEPRP